jgi:hypothetical protein
MNGLLVDITPGRRLQPPATRCGQERRSESREDRGPAARGGFDLDATVRVPAGARHHRERVYRYALRSTDRAEPDTATAEGDVLLEFRHRRSDGTMHPLPPAGVAGEVGAADAGPADQPGAVYGVLGGGMRRWRMRLPRTGITVPDPAAGVTDRAAVRRGRWRRRVSSFRLGADRLGTTGTLAIELAVGPVDATQIPPFATVCSTP